MVIIALCVFSEAILGAAMPSKEAARKSRKKENNRAYYEAHRESILSERKDKYSSECRSQRHANEYYKNVTASREKSAEATKTSFNKDLAKSRIQSAERQRNTTIKIWKSLALKLQKRKGNTTIKTWKSLVWILQRALKNITARMLPNPVLLLDPQPASTTFLILRNCAKNLNTGNVVYNIASKPWTLKK